MSAHRGVSGSVNWPAVHDEALDILVRYLRIPSVNPPGNEAPAARFLGGLIEAAGVPCEYIETAPGRTVADLTRTTAQSTSPAPSCAWPTGTAR